jgi:hypothetical protein
MAQGKVLAASADVPSDTRLGWARRSWGWTMAAHSARMPPWLLEAVTTDRATATADLTAPSARRPCEPAEQCR